MANSSALLEFVAPFEVAAFDPGPLQPRKTSMIVAATANCQRSLRMFMADFSSPLLPSTVPTRSYKSPMPDDRPTERTGSCALHQENPGDLQLLACKHNC